MKATISGKNMKLLIVEDDSTLRNLVAEHLELRGFAVDAVGRMDEARAAMTSSVFDLLLLDLGLPDGSGEDLLKGVRSAQGSGLPVIIFTARDVFQDRLDLLNAGADDFLLKPFDLLELEARIRAVLRRPGVRQAQILRCGNLSLDLVSRCAVIGNDDLGVSRREAALLEELLRAAERTVVREALEDRLYTFSEPVTPNALEALVSRLRRKIRLTNANIEIETKRGIGYRLVSLGAPEDV